MTNPNNIENQKQSSEVVNNPIEKGLKTIDDLFKAKEKRLKALTFISTLSTKCNLDEFKLPNQNKFFHKIWNKIFLVEKKR